LRECLKLLGIISARVSILLQPSDFIFRDSQASISSKRHYCQHTSRLGRVNIQSQALEAGDYQYLILINP